MIKSLIWTPALHYSPYLQARIFLSLSPSLLTCLKDFFWVFYLFAFDEWHTKAVCLFDFNLVKTITLLLCLTTKLWCLQNIKSCWSWVCYSAVSILLRHYIYLHAPYFSSEVVYQKLSTCLGNREKVDNRGTMESWSSG